MKRIKALWKRELLVFGIVFVIFCVFSVVLLTMVLWLDGQSGAPHFIGVMNYLRLFLADNVYLTALWNTVKWSLLIWLVLATILFVAKGLLLHRIPRVSPAVWDGVVYGTLFITPVIISKTVTMLLIRASTTSNAAQIIAEHLGDYSAGVPQQSPVSSFITAFVVLFITFIIWCAENLMHWILSKRKG